METLKEYPFKKLESGNAFSIDDFFKTLIEEQFSQKEAIKNLHKTLIDYLNLDDHTLFLRLYGSFKPEEYNSLRRGFRTEYPDGTKMVFCDNTFSMLFTALKLSGTFVDAEKLNDYLNQRKLVCSFGLTTEEKELAYYTPKDAIRIDLNSKGWYLAHIKPVGKSYNEINSLKEYFPIPDRNEWDGSAKTRKAEQNLNEFQKKLLKSHFLRLVHPLNSFLVPKRSNLIYSGKNIGEEVELLNYVRSFLMSEFKDEYQEFDELSEKYEFPDFESGIETIRWRKAPYKRRPSLNGNEKKSSKKNPEFFDEDSLGIQLERWLNSVGKKAFLDILPFLLENIDVDTEKIIKQYPEYQKTIKSRLSTVRSILRNGLKDEALGIILNSSRVPDDLKEKARQYRDSK